MSKLALPGPYTQRGLDSVTRNRSQVGDLVSAETPMVSGLVGGQWEKACPGYIAETLRCKMLILAGTLVRECRCAASLCDLDLTLAY